MLTGFSASDLFPFLGFRYIVFVYLSALVLHRAVFERQNDLLPERLVPESKPGPEERERFWKAKRDSSHINSASLQQAHGSPR